jgi:hypothetical protein
LPGRQPTGLFTNILCRVLDNWPNIALTSDSDSDQQKIYSDTDSDSADIYFGTKYSKVFFQWPTNIFRIQYYEENLFNCENMCVFSFNSSMCHVLLLNYSVWIRIRIRNRIFFGFGSGKKFGILSDSDPQHCFCYRYRYLNCIFHFVGRYVFKLQGEFFSFFPMAAAA